MSHVQLGELVISAQSGRTSTVEDINPINKHIRTDFAGTGNADWHPPGNVKSANHASLNDVQHGIQSLRDHTSSLQTHLTQLLATIDSSLDIRPRHKSFALTVLKRLLTHVRRLDTQLEHTHIQPIQSPHTNLDQ